MKNTSNNSQIDHRTKPYWRTVRYLGGGDNRYQCLSCKNTWDSLTEPGWFNQFKEVKEKDDFDQKYLTSDGTWHYIKNVDPVYHEIFKFCPFCGIRFSGPIRCNVDNEYMWGPKRLRRGEARLVEPSYWWVLELRLDKRYPWTTARKFNPYKWNANRIYDLLQREREHLCKDIRAVIVKHNDELKFVPQGY